MQQRPIAVIGMSVRLPQADGPDAFWRHLLDARDCVGDVPPQRWNAASFQGDGPGQPGLTYCSKAGMDAQADCYDAEFFSLDPEEARRMDPQQGMALELAWHAFEDAGIAPELLVGHEVGVFVVSTRDFDRRMANRWQQIDVRTSTGASAAIVANRISYVFGFNGPSLSLDSACASSLTSVHLACRAIENDECRLALAGGIQLILSPANIIAFAQGGLLARDGRCKPFSAAADGYVCGEGGGLVLLKPLDEALRDGNLIRAVIRGSAVNHNGRSNGLSAPYRPGQHQVIRKALERAAVSPTSVGYVEAHAVGTLLGDAIEVQAIRDIYGRSQPQGQTCGIGSVKSNIGHLEAAAGIAAFAKAALMVEHGMLPPSLHCEEPSALLRLDQGGVRLCTVSSSWPAGDTPRRAAVSAFGFGGANAHLILEQAPATAGNSPSSPGPWLLVVSAASRSAFASVAANYVDRLSAMRHGGAPLAQLRDFCTATWSTRQAMVQRRMLIVGDWDSAIGALRTVAPAQPAADGSIRVAVSPAQDAFEPPASWPALDADLAAVPTAAMPAARLIALLKRLGVVRLMVERGSPAMRHASELAARLGIEVVEAVRCPSRGRTLTLVDGVANADVVWRGGQQSVGQGLHLITLLFERGFALRWVGLAELMGGARMRLPLYPFERHRNHVVLDEIDPAVPLSTNAHSAPSLVTTP
jgi:3-oxoacyl-[acyl-carrier-protein] synthase II